MRVAALTGRSGSGKTTLLTQLIRHFVEEGNRVGAIKHTHHVLNEENRGDTSRFRAAGAEPVILARQTEAVIFRANGTERIIFANPRDLLALFDTDLVLVEGNLGGWPQIEIRDDARPTLDELIRNLCRIWTP